MYLRPRITIFHDLLSEQDIATIRGLATPRVSLILFSVINKTVNNIKQVADICRASRALLETKITTFADTKQREQSHW